MNEKNVIFDAWLSKLIGKETYRVIVDDSFLGSVAPKIIADLKAKEVFLYSKVPVLNVDAINALEKIGFHLVDTNVVFERPLEVNSDIETGSEIRFATKNDESAVVDIARNNFQYSRFHIDKDFSCEIANTIKAEWVRGYFLGQRGTDMVVAIIDNKPKGFLQLINDKKGTLIIDLIAVDKVARNKGLATSMIAFVINNFKDIKNIKVGTQIANKDSIRLYEKLGFKMTDVSYVFHCHL